MHWKSLGFGEWWLKTRRKKQQQKQDLQSWGQAAASQQQDGEQKMSDPKLLCSASVTLTLPISQFELNKITEFFTCSGMEKPQKDARFGLGGQKGI